jgi:hypothetical protein
MHQEIKTNPIPMFLVAIGRRFNKIRISRSEIDPAKRMRIDRATEDINSSFADSRTYRTGRIAGICASVESESSMS